MRKTKAERSLEKKYPAFFCMRNAGDLEILRGEDFQKKKLFRRIILPVRYLENLSKIYARLEGAVPTFVAVGIENLDRGISAHNTHP